MESSLTGVRGGDFLIVVSTDRGRKAGWGLGSAPLVSGAWPGLLLSVVCCCAAACACALILANRSAKALLYS